MARSRHHIVGAATFVSAFVAFNGWLYAWVKDTFFSQLAVASPVGTAVLVFIIIFFFCMVVITTLGLLWRWIENRRRPRIVAALKDCVRHDSKIIKEGMDRLMHEINIEREDYLASVESGNKYNWRHWETLAGICDLIRRTSRLYNLHEYPEMMAGVERYQELWSIREIRESIVQALDRIHQFLSDTSRQDVTSMHKADATIEDVTKTHLVQLLRYTVKFPDEG